MTASTRPRACNALYTMVVERLGPARRTTRRLAITAHLVGELAHRDAAQAVSLAQTRESIEDPPKRDDVLPQADPEVVGVPPQVIDEILARRVIEIALDAARPTSLQTRERRHIRAEKTTRRHVHDTSGDKLVRRICVMRRDQKVRVEQP